MSTIPLCLPNVYKFIQTAKAKKFFTWPSVRRELVDLLSLLPTMVHRMKQPLSDTLVATDASSVGNGVVISSLTHKEDTQTKLLSLSAAGWDAVGIH